MHVFGSLRCSKHNKYGGLSAMKIRRNILPLNFFGPAAVEYRYYIYSHLAQGLLNVNFMRRALHGQTVHFLWHVHGTAMKPPASGVLLDQNALKCVYMCAQMCIYICEYMHVCVLMMHW